jgi:peptidyl-prolyl cis-trans isomerase SurA
MKYILAAATIVLAMNVSAWGTTIDRVVAVVNNEIITGFQLEKELRASQELDRRNVLDRLIQETLERQRAKEIGLEVSEDELEAAIRDVQRQNDLTRSELEEALLSQGMSLEEYRETLRRQILRFRLLGYEVQSRVDVSSKEISAFYQDNIDDYREEAKVRISHITFPVSQRMPTERIEALRAAAQDALARLRSEEDFATVLLAYAPQGAVGGDMGRFSVTELSPSFARAVRDLNQGEVSSLVENAQGFHLLKVTEVVPGSVRQLDIVRDEIAEILREEKTGQALTEWAEGLRKKAYIDVRL